MKNILGHLFEYKVLSKEQAKEILIGISSGQYSNSEIASFLTIYDSVTRLLGNERAVSRICCPLVSCFAFIHSFTNYLSPCPYSPSHSPFLHFPYSTITLFIHSLHYCISPELTAFKPAASSV